MTEQAKVPAIRFAGFTDPWEQRKFGELYRPVSEKNDLSFGRDKAISVANMYFNPAVYVTEDSYLATYNVMRLGDIAFEGNRSKRFAHGRFVENTIGDGIVSHVFKVFRHVGDNYDLSYWKHAINNEKLMKDVLTRSTKASTMMHELVTADFLEELTLVPSLNEQRAIGAAIDSIDNLITLHQRKYDKLVIFKKSMLEKMFPKDGESVPEIRFAGFTDPWEQRKFVDFVEASGIRNKDNLQLESYSVSNDRGFVPQDEQFENGGTMRDADKTAYWIVEPGSFAYNPARINVGSIGYQSTRKNVIVSSLYEVFKTDRSCDDRFLWHWFKSSLFTKQIEMLQEGGVRLYFFFDKLQKSEIWMPNVDEQRIIGQQFDQLDSLITLHQRKLELLRNIKKSLLDKMFV